MLLLEIGIININYHFVCEFSLCSTHTVWGHREGAFGPTVQTERCAYAQMHSVFTVSGVTAGHRPGPKLSSHIICTTFLYMVI